MANATTKSDIFIISDSMVIHSSDLVVDYHGGLILAESPQDVVRGWTQTTVDSSKNWDNVWTFEDKYKINALGGVSCLASSGWYYSPEWVDLDGDGIVSNPTESYDVWHLAGGTPYGAWNGDAVVSYGNDMPYNDASYGDYRLFVDSDDDVWALARNSRTEALVTKLNKTTKGFVEVESRLSLVWSGTNCGLGHWDTVQDGNKLHIIWTDYNTISGSAIPRYLYSVFDMSTEAWTTEDQVIWTATDVDGTSRNTSIVVRSDGDVVALFSSNNETYGSYTFPRPQYSIRTGSTWSSPVIIWPSSSPEGQNPADESMKAVLGANDRVHIILHLVTYASTYYTTQRTLSSSDVLGSASTVATEFQTSYENGWASAATVDIGTDTYVHYLLAGKDWGKDAYYHVFKSEDTPTISRVVDNVDTGGGDDRRHDINGARGVCGFLFASDDGKMNVFRSDRDTWATNPGDGTHYLEDGRGGSVYTQMTQPSGEFGLRRQNFGAVLNPTGTSNIGDNYYNIYNAAEWIWPNLTENALGGGYFKMGTIEYLYLVPDFNAGTSRGGDNSMRTASPVLVYALDEIPAPTEEHTSDVWLKGTYEKDNTSDVYLYQEGATQSVDYPSDIVVVDRLTQSSDSYVLIVDRLDKSHSSDLMTSEVIELTVNIILDFTVVVQYEIWFIPPLMGIKVLDKNAYGPGRTIRRSV